MGTVVPSGTCTWSARSRAGTSNSANAMVFNICFICISPFLHFFVRGPFPRLHELLDLAFDQVALQGAHVTDEQPAVQMVGLMQEGAGQQAFALHLERLSVAVLRPHRHLVGAGDVL